MTLYKTVYSRLKYELEENKKNRREGHLLEEFTKQLTNRKVPMARSSCKISDWWFSIKTYTQYT